VKPTTLRRRLVIAFVALAVVVAVGLTVAVVAAVRLYDAQNQVTDRLFQAYSLAGDLNQAVVDQETGFRGYALTKDETFLEPYVTGLQRADEVNARLDTIEEDFPDLRKQRVSVQALVARWRTTVVEPGIAALRAGQTIDEATLLDGKEQFDDIRVAVDDYRAAILQHRVDSVNELQRNNIVLFGVIGLGVLVLIVTAGLAWLALRRWVTEPLETLGHEVDLVEGGDLSHEIDMGEAPEEIRILAEQIDRMRLRILEEYAAAVTAQNAAEEAQQMVEEQAEDLRRSNAELEQFAYVASHDLQEPLRKVASFCQLLERRYKGQLDERGEQYIEFAVDGAKRMQQLINDLLAFSRVGRLTSDFVDVDLSAALAQALTQLDLVVSEADAQLTSDPLPTVQGENTLLVQLFQNLIGNGIKFSGGSTPRIHIGVRRDGDVWEFCCSDNGIGIEQQYEDKIFVIFQRLHGRDVYGGTGIGLAMCKKIVEYHGGRMWLDTTVTEGATFRWTLPVNERGRVRDDAVAARPPDRGAAGGGRPG
jgi:signal transduction histidine kinase